MRCAGARWLRGRERERGFAAVELAAGVAFLVVPVAVQAALAKGAPQILEPIMKIEVSTPEEFMGGIMGDLNGKRGRIELMEDRGPGTKAIDAFVPLSEMFGYSTSLRSMSQGRASYTMEFDHYAEVPNHVAAKLAK